MGFLQEFKEFAVKGNVIDMAVGVVIGGAFGKIVSSLVDGIIMPPIAYYSKNVKLEEFGPVLGVDDDGKKVVIQLGEFVTTCIHFVIIAFVIFLVIKQINRLKKPAAEPVAPDTKKCGYCLEEIPAAASKCKFCTADQ